MGCRRRRRFLSGSEAVLGPSTSESGRRRLRDAGSGLRLLDKKGRPVVRVGDADATAAADVAGAWSVDGAEEVGDGDGDGEPVMGGLPTIGCKVSPKVSLRGAGLGGGCGMHELPKSGEADVPVFVLDAWSPGNASFGVVGSIDRDASRRLSCRESSRWPSRCCEEVAAEPLGTSG